MRIADAHAQDALYQARSGRCREALHWLDVAQRELVRAADDWPSGLLDVPEENAVERLEEASDEVIARCGRSRARRRRR